MPARAGQQQYRLLALPGGDTFSRLILSCQPHFRLWRVYLHCCQ
ncbi:hypothetical protein GJA_101 [Janthinobacterium agaricidamnosum NBRC 102515 = DSM 9628]|uniref:Uncharacterized protein n=1 Tax=Janthinobacterium agaricidamnosum NBRC 102515 = DSM 9628 TaxID=1349767 RepID=W0UWL9_9BURK|nr:hypothetical protein GJA_101 [Janthinobacterium agaricidamnosum NBRC 102515 = DSM 9628]